jgi:hypothetical protein
MKVLVLLAGCVGVLGFFQPFFEFREHPISAYRMLHGTNFDDSFVYRLTKLRDDHNAVPWQSGPYVEVDRHASPVPMYFASAIVMIVVALVAFAMRRFSGFGALFSLAAGMLAIGGWLRELRIDRDLVRAGGQAMMTSGATLLLVSGLVGFAASIAVLIKREPAPPKPPPEPPEIELPVARVIS